MISRHTTKIVAIVLAIIAGLVCILGYDFVSNENITPKEYPHTLDT